MSVDSVCHLILIYSESDPERYDYLSDPDGFEDRFQSAAQALQERLGRILTLREAAEIFSQGLDDDLLRTELIARDLAVAEENIFVWTGDEAVCLEEE